MNSLLVLLDEGAARLGPALRAVVLLGVPAYLGFRWVHARDKAGEWLSAVVFFAFLFVLVLPLLRQLGQVAELAAASALVWAVPGIVLGSMAPFLSRPSENPRLWAAVAFASGALLLLVAVLRPEGWGRESAPLLAFTFVLLLAAGVFALAGARLREGWPFLALSVGALVWSFHVLVHDLTFGGVLHRFDSLRSHPVALAPKALETLPPDLAWWLDPAEAASRAAAARAAGHHRELSADYWRDLRHFDEAFGSAESSAPLPGGRGELQDPLGRVPGSRDRLAAAVLEHVREDLAAAERFLASHASPERKAGADPSFAASERFEILRKRHRTLAAAFPALREENREAKREVSDRPGRRPHPSAFLALHDDLAALAEEVRREAELADGEADTIPEPVEVTVGFAVHLETLGAASRRLQTMETAGAGGSAELSSRLAGLMESLSNALRSHSEHVESTPRVEKGFAKHGALAVLAEEIRYESEKLLGNYGALGTRSLELALASCFGFWAAVGFLMVWTERGDPIPRRPSPP